MLGVGGAPAHHHNHAPGEAAPRGGRFGRGEIVPRVRKVVLGTAPDFKDCRVHLPTFLWQLQCFAERVIRKRLSDSFIHNSASVRLSANSSRVFRHGQRLC